MAYKLFLDDIRTLEMACLSNPALAPLYRKEEWVIVRSYKEFVKCIEERGLPSMVSFDHDLADEHYAPEEYWDTDWHDHQEFREKTGYDCAKYLKEKIGNEIVVIMCHSSNPVGKEKILNLFNRKIIRN